jgi:hypothetical protein
MEQIIERRKNMKARSALSLIFLLIALPAVAGGKKVPLENGASLFYDETGATWIDNNLTLTVFTTDPGIVSPYCYGIVSSSGLPQGIVGISFDQGFDPLAARWGFLIFAYSGDSLLGEVSVEPTSSEVVEIWGSSEERANGETHVKILKTKDGKINVNLDFPWFSEAVDYVIIFHGSNQSVLRRFEFGDINWLVRHPTS